MQFDWASVITTKQFRSICTSKIPRPKSLTNIVASHLQAVVLQIGKFPEFCKSAKKNHCGFHHFSWETYFLATLSTYVVYIGAFRKYFVLWQISDDMYLLHRNHRNKYRMSHRYWANFSTLIFPSKINISEPRFESYDP